MPTKQKKTLIPAQAGISPTIIEIPDQVRNEDKHKIPDQVRKERKNLQTILDSFKTRRIMVLGDLMLDEYLWGKVQRISPEAPVPVVEINSTEYRPGGAANVALNLAALGVQAELVGVTGADPQAETLKNLLKQKGIATEGLIADRTRPTTLKTRIGAASQQIVRIDREDTSELSPRLENAVYKYIKTMLSKCDALIIEDYDKGLLHHDFISIILELASRQGIVVAVDPKLQNFDAYREVDILKPNYKELHEYMGRKFQDEEEFIAYAGIICRQFGLNHLVVTRGSQGMFIFGQDKLEKHLPSFARDVYDVSGAGDTVISAMTATYLYKRDIISAALVANHAAAVVVAKHGTATASSKEIWESFHEA
jgi:D-beta-D-heptose 7-phosphate kinase/D-beta-D-heptose 1-phosphate adenosyltransferase